MKIITLKSSDKISKTHCDSTAPSGNISDTIFGVSIVVVWSNFTLLTEVKSNVLELQRTSGDIYKKLSFGATMKFI